MEKQNKRFISQFNPEVVTVDDSLQESYVLKSFDAGYGYGNFKDFIPMYQTIKPFVMNYDE